MQRRSGWIRLTAAMLLAGALLAPQVAGAAPTPTPAPSEAQKAPENLSPAQKEVLKQLRELRKRHREQLRTESRELVEKAVKEGKLTREEGDQLLKRLIPRHLPQPKSVEEMKARLDEAVRAGRMTQQQADRILQRFKEAQAKASEQSQKEGAQQQGPAQEQGQAQQQGR